MKRPYKLHTHQTRDGASTSHDLKNLVAKYEIFNKKQQLSIQKGRKTYQWYESLPPPLTSHPFRLSVHVRILTALFHIFDTLATPHKGVASNIMDLSVVI